MSASTAERDQQGSRGEKSTKLREWKRESTEAAIPKIKHMFRQWDKDGDGIISRHELALAMRAMGVVDSNQLDSLLQEADKDGNGAIDCDEFVDWLMRPGSHVSQCDNRAVLFDFDAVFRPLFNVFDRDRSGFITVGEFAEIHTMLHNSLTLCPREDGEAPDPGIMVDSPRSVFASIDGNKDAQISFSEFVEWQRAAIQDSGLVNEELKELVGCLARSLQSVFKIEQREKDGNLSASDTMCLQKIIESLATHTRNLWNTQKAAAFESNSSSSSKYPNLWSEPPIGLSIESLKRAHMHFCPINLRGATVRDVTLRTLCVPDIDIPVESTTGEPDVPDRCWIAEVVRTITTQENLSWKHRAGQAPRTSSAQEWCEARRSDFEEAPVKVIEEAPHYYVFSKESLSWCRAEDGAGRFDKAVNSMAPEMTIFCLLKTEANFGVKIRWDQIQAALASAVDLHLLEKTQHAEYNFHMEALMLKTLKEDDQLGDFYDSLHVSEELKSRITLAPRSVMATLSDLGIVRVSEVWSHFMD